MSSDRSEQFRRRLQSLAFRLVPTSQGAENLISRAYEHLGGVEGSPEASPCGPCLVGVMYRLFLNDCRAERGLPPGEPLPPRDSCRGHHGDVMEGDGARRAEGPACATSRRGQSQVSWARLTTGNLTEAVEQLPPREGRIFRAHRDGLSYGEAAVRLELSRDEVAEGLRCARRRLLAWLRENYPGDQ